MIKKIELYWNITHYIVYRALCIATFIVDRHSPITLLLDTHIFKKWIERRGGTIKQINNATDKVLNNPIISVNVWYADLIMMILPVVFLSGLEIYCVAVFNDTLLPSIKITTLILICDVIISYLLNYVLLFHKDKYLYYFKKLDHKTSPKMYFISLLIISLPFLVIITSFFL